MGPGLAAALGHGWALLILILIKFKLCWRAAGDADDIITWRQHFTYVAQFSVPANWVAQNVEILIGKNA